jgi:hypothetical protein
MEKSEIKKSILRSFEAELDAWLEVEPKITDAFEYERSLLERTLRIGKSILEQSSGKLSRDRNFKKK